MRYQLEAALKYLEEHTLYKDVINLQENITILSMESDSHHVKIIQQPTRNLDQVVIFLFRYHYSSS